METFASDTSLDYHLQLLTALLTAALEQDSQFQYSTALPELFQVLRCMNIASFDTFTTAIIRAIQRCFCKQHYWRETSYLWQSCTNFLLGLSQVGLINFDGLLKVCEVILAESYDLEHSTCVLHLVEDMVYRLQMTDNAKLVVNREGIHRMRSVFLRRVMVTAPPLPSPLPQQTSTQAMASTATCLGYGVAEGITKKLNQLVSLLTKVDCRA